MSSRNFELNLQSQTWQLPFDMWKKPQFKCFLGIDQTGAQLRKGQAARPLPAALLWKSDISSQWQLHLGFLDRLTREHTFSYIEAHTHPPRSWCLMVDCVFGLPLAVYRGRGSQTLWNLMGQTHLQSPAFGRKPAQEFFKTLGAVKGFPRRHCELKAQANSVFQTHPFQKNIQTGTYRIWRDLTDGQAQPWLHIWPFEWPEKTSKPWMFEAFPTLLWKTLLHSPSRSAPALIEWLDHQSTWLHCQNRELLLNADIRDAVVLALGGFLLQQQKRLFKPFAGFRATPRLRSEGWIAGLHKT